MFQNATQENAEYPFKLGLDLAGGSHLVYEADVSQVDLPLHTEDFLVNQRLVYAYKAFQSIPQCPVKMPRIDEFSFGIQNVLWPMVIP